MPRAANSTTSSLRRNQACKQCRKRKLKCDAQRPHCGTCQKQWTAQISVPPPVGFAHPVEPLCTYDPIEGLVLAPETVEDPLERVRLLEAQISQLQSKLNAAQVETISRSGHSHSPQESHTRNFDSNSPPGHSNAAASSSHSMFAHSHDYQSTSYPGGGHSTQKFPLGEDPRARAHSTAGTSYNGAGNNYGTSPAMSNGADTYYTTGLQSDVRNVGYPTVDDEQTERLRGQHRAGSHPYQRDQHSISSIMQGSRSGDGYADGIASVSRLSRQGESRSRGYSIINNPSPPFYDIMYSGWSRDLPPRQDLANYIEIFFRCDPCGSRMLHRPTLLSNLNYPPTHPDFPHPALLHAICATSSRFTLRGRLDASMASLSMSPQGGAAPLRDKFAEFHANKTRAYVNQTMSNGQNIFDVFQACMILSWWFYSEGRWVEVWVQAGFQTRAVIPLGLNYLGLVKRGADGAPVKNPYLAPPKSLHETETRRRAWWMSVMFDRIVSVGGWLHSVDERDIGTELPLTSANYEAGSEMPSHPQTLHSENTYTYHPINYTDPFILFLKSIMLFGRITDYSVRMGIRAPLLQHGRGAGLDETSPRHHGHDHGHGLSPNANPNIPRTPSPVNPDDPRHAPGFRVLDRLVSVDFINSFPPPFRSCLGVGDAGDGSNFDTDLYMAHLVPHAATITLHSPWVNYAEPATCPSVARCMEAARAILDKYYVLRSTSFDITLLHPFVTICWYLAAVVQVHLCKRLIEIGDIANEATCWGEINMLRNALVTYGNYSPIGTRQEKMLHPIMQEIINMTSQEQPLLVGLPLYPFSLDSAFQLPEKKALAEAAAAGLLSSADEGDAGDAIAPIPDVAFGEDVAMTDHTPNIALPSMQGIGGWSMQNN